MKDFIDFLKLPPNILGALSIASGTLLLLPQKLAQKFYIINFREKYGFTIGIVFVISTALLIVLLLSKIFHFFYDKYASKRLGTAQIKYLKNMTPEQVTIIREFLREPTHTLPLPMNNNRTSTFTNINPCRTNSFSKYVRPTNQLFFTTLGN